MVATDVASRGIGMNKQIPLPIPFLFLYLSLILHFLPLPSCDMVRALLLVTFSETGVTWSRLLFPLWSFLGQSWVPIAVCQAPALWLSRLLRLKRVGRGTFFLTISSCKSRILIQGP